MHLASFDASIFLAIMYLPVIAGIAFKLFTSYQHSEKKNILLLQQKTEAELKFLKSQIHPHFLFNTLNNLYAQTLEKSDQAPETVLQLSELLSYILYEGNQKRVKLDRELEQLNNFIELEKLRYHDRVQIRLDIQPGIGNLEVIPLLFLPLLENAFKHGVKPDPGLSEIELKVFRKDKQLNIICKNTVPQKSKDHQIGGIGLENLEQRLKLSYRENYKLVVELKEGYFTVKIVLW
jgi:LytS/YehU family sensor histidine kinase